MGECKDRTGLTYTLKSERAQMCILDNRVYKEEEEEEEEKKKGNTVETLQKRAKPNSHQRKD